MQKPKYIIAALLILGLSGLVACSEQKNQSSEIDLNSYQQLSEQCPDCLDFFYERVYAKLVHPKYPDSTIMELSLNFASGHSITAYGDAVIHLPFLCESRLPFLYRLKIKATRTPPTTSSISAISNTDALDTLKLEVLDSPIEIEFSGPLVPRILSSKEKIKSNVVSNYQHQNYLFGDVKVYVKNKLCTEAKLKK